MSKDNLAFPGGLAYLIDDKELNKVIEVKSKGLTKREYYAGLAMQSILEIYYKPLANNEYKPESVVKHAVKYADALLEELDKDE